MKKLHFIFAWIVAGLAFSGCNDWLDISPRSQIKSEVLFATEDGYKQALNGVYIKMGQSSLYGRNASMFVPDALARLWTVPSSGSTSALYGLSTFDYKLSATESTLSSLFSSYYNAIVQINDILENLGTTTTTFSYNNDKLIEGEALGLRALLHMDILRLWGPVPGQAVGSELTIPYVDEATKEIDKLTSRSWDDVVAHIEQDLTESENILKLYDPVTRVDMDSLNNLNDAKSNAGVGSMPADDWQVLRKSRFNYYAALAAKARLYHWIGKTDQAIDYARRVVDSEKFKLCTESMMSQGLTMYPEHIFGIENVDLLTSIQSDFDSSNPTMTQTQANTDKAYESGVNPSDIRYIKNRYWKMEYYPNGASVNTFLKYIGNEDVDSDKRIPMIRLAEMYLILMEDLPLAEAKPYFTAFRTARGMSESLDDASFASEEARKDRLEQEYRKEFYGEGQMFYFYKKHEYTAYRYPGNYSLTLDKYVLPKPQGLINFE